MLSPNHVDSIYNQRVSAQGGEMYHKKICIRGIYFYWTLESEHMLQLGKLSKEWIAELRYGFNILTDKTPEDVLLLLNSHVLHWKTAESQLCFQKDQYRMSAESFMEMEKVGLVRSS